MIKIQLNQYAAISEKRNNTSDLVCRTALGSICMTIGVLGMSSGKPIAALSGAISYGVGLNLVLPLLLDKDEKTTPTETKFQDQIRQEREQQAEKQDRNR